jgi:hypothetical protein
MCGNHHGVTISASDFSKKSDLTSEDKSLKDKPCKIISNSRVQGEFSPADHLQTEADGSNWTHCQKLGGRVFLDGFLGHPVREV